MWRPNVNLAVANGSSVWNSYGLKFFELSNHLGNNMVVISDARIQNGSTYEPVVVNANDYYAFGGQMPGRSYSSPLGVGGYRYGFNGKENDNEVKGEGRQQDYGMRIYDPRIGRFLSVDPLQKQYPELTPYQFASNTPIQAIDLDGLEKVHYTLTYSTSGTPTLTQGKTELTYSYMLFWSKKYEPTATIHYNGGTYNFRLNNNVGNQFDRDPLQNLGAEYDFNRLGEFLSNRGNADGNSGGRWFPSEERVGEHILINSLAAGTRAMAEHSGSLSLYKSFSNNQFKRANNGSSESEPIVINLKYKEGWSIEQKVEAQLKVAVLNTKQLVVTGVPKRQNNLRTRYEKANNTKLATDVDVDHTHDLQLGGADALNNTNGLNNSVNRSLGKQINNAIKNLPKGTKVDKVMIN